MNMEPFDIVKKTIAILDAKKAEDIAAIRVTDITIVADYFVICTANNVTQLRSLYDEIEFKLKQENIVPIRVDGERESGWIVLDYASVIIHIFLKDQRDFYDIERLWSDGEQVDISEMLIKTE